MPVASHQNANDAKVPVLLHVDPAQPGHSQYGIHNRWHPDIPSIGSIEAGRSYKVQCLDYSGGQIKNDDDVQDVKDLNHDSDHHLSGPFDVASAQPGDLLEIEIQSVEPFPDHAWGYSVVAPGLGSLDHPDYTTRYVKSIWDFDGPFTSSRHVPGVRFVGRPHPGVVGTAPSHELLRQWNERESRCVAGDADLPCRNGAYVGQTLQQDVGDRIYAEGARTSPAREHGGNIDIGGLVGGSKLYLPVYVPGAKLSFGDCHFSIGDGEPTTAIEMAGIVTFKVNILPARAFKISSPAYLTSPSEPQYGERLVFTGLSASGDQQSSMDGMTAYRNAAFQAIDHLVKHGFSREQAYILLAVAPIETRIVATANRPNTTVSLGLPLGIFDVDIRPRDSSLY